jgi:hypothetical protein
MRHLIAAFAIAAMLAGAGTAPAQGKREDLADRVRKSIDGGVRYLLKLQRDNGSWEIDGGPLSSGLGVTTKHPAGKTSLVVLALLNAGAPANDGAVKRGLDFLRAIRTPNSTYAVALQTLAYVEANLPEDRQRIQDNIRWLLDTRVVRGNGEFIGWSYGDTRAGIADNSNTQYAVLALWAAKQIGIDIPKQAFEQIQTYYLNHQSKQLGPNDGSWVYAVGTNFAANLNAPSMTMTVAGVCGLFVSGMELDVRREVLRKDGTADNCGKYEENPAIHKGLAWIARNFELTLPQRTFYHLYGIERLGRLSGQRYIGGHDWYREGCKFLVDRQRPDGSWAMTGAWDNWPEVSTSFALLFLSKGRTPVLMSNIVHGQWPRADADTDWNNDRNDLRHMVDYAAKKMFKMPLAWQNYDMLRALNSHATDVNLREDDYQAVTAEMLQSPILYITGHRSVLGRFRDAEINLLKRYVENGGFIVAEACCGREEFHDGFKEFVARVWPKAEFALLPADHAIYTGYAAVTPGQPYEIWGLNQGCKTVLVYSPQDFSCRWENGWSAEWDQGKSADPRTVQAFRLGANIIAYATGMEPPRPRLTKIDVASNKRDPANIPRGFLKVAQITIPGDPAPAPRAMRNLLEHVQEYAGVDVALTTEPRFVGDEALIDFKFIYMHGRKSFTFGGSDLKPLRFNLETGGLLFADACCGKEAFDKSFRKFMEELFPGKKLEPVPQNDELYGADLNGEALTEDNIECRKEVGGPMRKSAPALEGIKHNGRWIVLYSKYDIGCALERHQSSDCRGYSPASAQKLARAGLLYTLRP